MQVSPNHNRRKISANDFLQGIDLHEKPIGHHDQVFHPSVDQHVEVPSDACPVVMSVHYNRQIFGGLQLMIDASQDQSAKWVGQIEHHHPDGVAALVSQRTGEDVRAICQPVRDLADAPFRLGSKVLRLGAHG
jgi:hypothetical protein